MANIGRDFHKGATIRVEGIRELNRKLEAAGKSTDDMRNLMHSLGLIVIANARPPRQSGELAGTLRSGRGKTKAVVRAGYASRGAYAGVVHYGDPHPTHRRRPHPFLTDALKRSRAQVVTALATGINRILITNNLN